MNDLPPLPGKGEVKTVINVPEILAPLMQQQVVPSFNGDPMKFMEAVMDNPSIDLRIRFEAAKVLMPFKHAKLGEEGKKSKQTNRAEQVSGGRYGTRGNNQPALPH